MASQGEIIFQQFIGKIQQKVSTRFMTARDAQSIGKFFWPLLSQKFKQELKIVHGRNAFWDFAQYLKQCFINGEMGPIYDLWLDFDQNGKNLYETFYENSLNKLVHDVL
jgi:hypothetical protein